MPKFIYDCAAKDCLQDASVFPILTLLSSRAEKFDRCMLDCILPLCAGCAEELNLFDLMTREIYRSIVLRASIASNIDVTQASPGHVRLDWVPLHKAQFYGEDVDYGDGFGIRRPKRVGD